MKKAILIRFLMIIAAALVLMTSISALFFADGARQQAQEDMLRLVRVIAQQYPGQQSDLSGFVAQCSQNAKGARVSVIAPDGSVLADSNASPSQMDNHSGRQEVEQALSTGTGIAQRTSSTLGKGLLYVAVRTQDGNVLRVAQEYDGVLAGIARQLPALLTAALASLLIGIFLARRFSAAVTKPLTQVAKGLDQMKQGNYEVQFDDVPYEELDQIIRRIQALAKENQSAANKLYKEREKVDFILNNMEEGMVLLDKYLEILTVNNSAKSFFGCQRDVVGKHLVHLVSDTKIGNAVSEALSAGKSSLFDLTLPDGRIVSVHITQVTGDFIRNAHQNVGVIILIIDVTTDRKSYQLRQDFFSNASHELKTPITSIQGFAELLEAGIIRDPAKQQEYLSRIIAESKRMANLINDILMISRLEAGIRDEETVYVDLGDVCREIVDTVAPQAGAQNIQMEVVGSAGLFANRDQMHELAANLISNAVKYNKQNGWVKVKLTDLPQKVKLKVSDTGIGIPAESQSRIFERFYRVDKGRSRRIGGTGLGLSIVKHIVNVYGGEITLKSMENEGTSITVTLPKQKPQTIG